MRRALALAAAVAAGCACSGQSSPSPGPAADPLQVCLQALTKVPGAIGVGAAGALPGAGNRVECGFRMSSGDALRTYEVGADGIPHASASTPP